MSYTVRHTGSEGSDHDFEAMAERRAEAMADDDADGLDRVARLALPPLMPWWSLEQMLNDRSGHAALVVAMRAKYARLVNPEQKAAA